MDYGLALLVDVSPELAEIHSDQLDIFSKLALALNRLVGIDNFFQLFFCFVTKPLGLMLMTVRVPDFDQVVMSRKDFIGSAHGAHLKNGVGAGQMFRNRGTAAQIGVSA